MAPAGRAPLSLDRRGACVPRDLALPLDLPSASLPLVSCAAAGEVADRVLSYAMETCLVWNAFDSGRHHGGRNRGSRAARSEAHAAVKKRDFLNDPPKSVGNCGVNRARPLRINNLRFQHSSRTRAKCVHLTCSYS